MGIRLSGWHEWGLRIGDGESLSGMNANLDGSRRDLIIGRDLTLINRETLFLWVLN